MLHFSTKPVTSLFPNLPFISSIKTILRLQYPSDTHSHNFRTSSPLSPSQFSHLWLHTHKHIHNSLFLPSQLSTLACTPFLHVSLSLFFTLGNIRSAHPSFILPLHSSTTPHHTISSIPFYTTIPLPITKSITSHPFVCVSFIPITSNFPPKTFN